MAESIPRILVCDDEDFFRDSIREVLTGERLDVIEAADGASALELAADPAVGVMVLDVRLPGIDGLDVLRQLGETRPDLRVIMLSANNDQELVLEALRLGACDYLAKPIHDEELVLAVRRAAEVHAIAEDWGRLRGRVERLASQLEEVSRRASQIEQEEERGAIVALALVEATSDVLEAARTSLLLAGDGGDELRVAALNGRSRPPNELAPIRRGQGVAGAAFELAEPLHVVDINADERFALHAREDRYESRSFAMAPLQIGDRRLGLLCATDRAGGGVFSSEDLALLRLLAGYAARLLEPGRALPVPEVDPPADEADGDAELARAICDAITNELEPQRIFDASLQPIGQALSAAPVSLYLIEAEQGLLRCEASCDGSEREDRASLPLDAGLTGSVLQTGRMVATDAPELDARFVADVDTPADGEAGPIVCAPLSLRGKVVGVFRAFPRDGVAASARTAEVVAAALSAAVRNALLYRSLLESIDEVAEARRTARL